MPCDRTRQALRYLSEDAIRHRVDSKRWRRACRGVLVTVPGELSNEQQWWIAVLSAGKGSVLAGLAAAQAAGLRGRWSRAAVDVLRPAKKAARQYSRLVVPGMPVVKVHRTSIFTAADVQRGRPHRTSIARSVVDATAWAPTDIEAASIVSAACQQRLVTPAELAQALARLTHVRRHSLVVSTAQFADLGATTPAEIAYVKLCRKFRLPVPKMQVKRRDRAGRTRYLDGYYEAYRVHIEIDGAQHLDAKQWASDLKRQNDIWVEGDRLLRFPAWLVVNRPEDVAAQVRAALIAAGWNARS